jgi:hypothetical protein
VKLSNLEDAIEFRNTRASLMKQHDAVTDGVKNFLGITLQGTYQDEEFVAACRQAVERELVRRIRIMENRLSDLGVEVME